MSHHLLGLSWLRERGQATGITLGVMLYWDPSMSSRMLL